jgi:hypothetical protein
MDRLHTTRPAMQLAAMPTAPALRRQSGKQAQQIKAFPGGAEAISRAPPSMLEATIEGRGVGRRLADQNGPLHSRSGDQLMAMVVAMVRIAWGTSGSSRGRFLSEAPAGGRRDWRGIRQQLRVADTTAGLAMINSR